jgi:hypothetical protein
MQTTKTVVSIAIMLVMLLCAAPLISLDKASAQKSSSMSAIMANQNNNSTISSTSTSSSPATRNWTDSFVTQKCPLFVPSGSNGYFNINPGHKTVLTGIEGKSGDHLRLTITVTPQVKMLGGVLTRLVEERAIDTQTGALKEIALNYFAMCKPTNSVYYFGEYTTDYQNGTVIGHQGSWQHGLGNQHGGLIFPGTVLLGSRYYQEVAPGVALDRAEIVNLNAQVNTPLGVFHGVQTNESTTLEPNATEYKIYDSQVGLVYDHGLLLVSHN